MTNKFHKWIAIAVGEILLSLTLICAAPTLLNSKYPQLGFAIWLGVPTILGGSGIYATAKLRAATKAREIFLAEFPEYSSLPLSDFLDVTPEFITDNLDLFKQIQQDSVYLSPIDIIKATKDDNK